MKKLFVLSALALVLPFSVHAHDPAHAHAAMQVSDPWVRATVPQQRATGAFMTLTATSDARLVGVASPAARVVEVHEMTLGADNVMRMRAIDVLTLSAGESVELKPGGYHVMLIDLKEQVREGDMIPLTLKIEHADGTRNEIEVVAPVRSLTQQHGGSHGQHRH